MNENQKTVLSWLKLRSVEYNPFGCIDDLLWQSRKNLLREEVSVSHSALDDEDKFQVLQAFADWGLKENAE